MTVFERLCVESGVGAPEKEFMFCPGRKWRADWCWPIPGPGIILEVDGGTWTGGRHTRGKGFKNDCEKLNTAAIMGYRVLRVSPQQFNSGEALELVMRCVENSK